jgi:hypothetical protein
MQHKTWLLIALVYLCIAELFSWVAVPDLSLCLIQPEHSRQTTKLDDPKYCPAFHNGVEILFERTDHFLEVHDKSVIGAFTIVLAISTIGLWLATNKLWAAGEKQFELLAETAVQQSRDMKESITAAKDSADIARQSLLSTQRAYVRVVDFPWLWRPDTSRPGKYFYDIIPIVENGGNTQTVDLKINVNFALRDEVLPENFDFPFAGPAGISLIGAHQTIRASNLEILDDDLLAVRDRKKFFYIWGTISYRDVFENTPEHTTEFCTQITRVLGDPLDPRDAGNPKGTSVEIYFGIYHQHQNSS